jgi:hypothetical protein
MHTESSTADPQKRKRRWFQFSLESAKHDDDVTKKGVPPWHAFS